MMLTRDGQFPHTMLPSVARASSAASCGSRLNSLYTQRNSIAMLPDARSWRERKSLVARNNSILIIVVIALLGGFSRETAKARKMPSLRRRGSALCADEK
jgi:hypothetical protein